MLWHWRNDPATLAGSRSSTEVLWEDHLRWLTSSLTRTDQMVLMVEDPNGPVGTVRWDLDREADREPGPGQDWEVSITVAPQRRGQALARPLLRVAEVALSDALAEHTSERTTGDSPEATLAGWGNLTAFLAIVNIANESSMRLFETSAYLPDLPPDPQGFMRFRKPARVA